jgi:hypothetical protein
MIRTQPWRGQSTALHNLPVKHLQRLFQTSLEAEAQPLEDVPIP